MADQIAIVGTGLMTPIGLGTRETAASARSRLARLTSIEWRDSRFRRFTVGMVPDDALPALDPELAGRPLTYREARMLRMGGAALNEALRPLPRSAGAVPLILGLPELQTTVPLRVEEFLNRLKSQASADLDLAASRGIARGRAAAILALAEARRMLVEGTSPWVVVGGVDSNVDLHILGRLDVEQRVRTDSNPDGFAPGEGAGFALLTTATMARRHGLRMVAGIEGTGEAREEGHLYSERPYLGEGLAAAFESLFGRVRAPGPIGCLYVSFNGEHYWAKELGVALLRHREHFADPHRVEHPAECFGDLGAAHGAALLVLAGVAANRAGAGTATLVSASSDLGDRAVALLTGR